MDPANIVNITGSSKAVIVRGSRLAVNIDGSSLTVNIRGSAETVNITGVGNTVNIKQDDHCHFLRLPAELRVAIYEYVFTSDDDPKGTDLLYPCPPSHALVRTSREIFNESKPVFDQAARAYWSTTEFVVQDAYYALAALYGERVRLPGPRALGLITKLWIRAPDYEGMYSFPWVLTENGVWSDWTSYFHDTTKVHYNVYTTSPILSTPAAKALIDNEIGGDVTYWNCKETWDDEPRPRTKKRIPPWQWHQLGTADKEKIPALKQLVTRTHLTEKEVFCALIEAEGMVLNDYVYL
jgi:hypothetical protein